MKNDSIENIRLEMKNHKSTVKISVRKGDTKTRTVHATLANSGSLISLKNALLAEIIIDKPDGTQCYNNCVIDGDEIQYTIRSQAINVEGICKCHFEITYEDGAVVYSPEFSMVVYDPMRNKNVIKSQNEYSALTEQVVMAKGYAQAAEKSADNSKESAESAYGYANSAINSENNTKLYYDEILSIYEVIKIMSVLKLGTEHTDAFYGDLGEIAYKHSQNTGNPHGTTAAQIGADAAGSAQSSYENAVAYTDKAIADLINGAPSTLDTLKEVSDAMSEHEDVVNALNEAIGTKANANEVNSMLALINARIDTIVDMLGYPI